MIAWRLQERAFGDLDHDSLAFLDRLARQSGSRRRQLNPGTVLVREYQGRPGRGEADLTGVAMLPRKRVRTS